MTETSRKMTRPVAIAEGLVGRQELAAGLAAELQELTHAIEELERGTRP